MKYLFNAAVIVAALGYFVDIYDLLLFSIVRVDSLRSLGFAGRELEVGATLNNIQMTGLMVGGIAWGILADKKGRLSVLFGSIFLYSVANFLNAYVQSFSGYAWCRFFAGLGLAGELGAGITLVSEILPAESRGLGTMIVATIGVSGAVVGGWVAQVFDWRVAFQIGGGLGFALLLLRIGVSESKIFTHTQAQCVTRGNFFSLFTSRERFKRFACCILTGIPTWYTIGLLIVYAPELAKAFGVTEPVSTAKAVMFNYAGLVVGDFGSSLWSHLMKSRNHAVRWLIVLNFCVALVYLFGLTNSSANAVYAGCFMLGITAGFWAVIVTMGAEQFGTNLRGTAATAIPNFIRFSLVPTSLLFLWMKNQVGLIHGAAIVGVIVSGISLWASFGLKETFGKDLNFLEKG